MPIVRPSRVGRAMLVLTLLLVVSGLAVLYDQNGWNLPLDELGGFPNGIVKAGGSFAPLVIVSITLMVVAVEGGAMVSEAFLKRRYEQGAKDTQAKWEEWLARKEEAEKAGRSFDDPPPNKKN